MGDDVSRVQRQLAANSQYYEVKLCAFVGLWNPETSLQHDQILSEQSKKMKEQKRTKRVSLLRNPLTIPKYTVWPRNEIRYFWLRFLIPKEKKKKYFSENIKVASELFFGNIFSETEDH